MEFKLRKIFFFPLYLLIGIYHSILFIGINLKRSFSFREANLMRLQCNRKNREKGKEVKIKMTYKFLLLYTFAGLIGTIIIIPISIFLYIKDKYTN